MTKHPYTKLNSDYFDDDNFESFKIDEKIVKACQDHGFDVDSDPQTITEKDVHGNFDAFSFWLAYHFIPATEQPNSYGIKIGFVQFYNDCYDNLSLSDQNKYQINQYYFDERHIIPEAKAYLAEHGIEDVKKAHRLVDYQKWHGAQLVQGWAHDRNLPIDLDRHLISYQFYPLYIDYARQLSKQLGSKPANTKAVPKSLSAETSQVVSSASVSAPIKSSVVSSVSVSPSSKMVESSVASFKSTVSKVSVSQSSQQSVSSKQPSSTAPSLTSAQQKSLNDSIRDSIIAEKVAESVAKSSAMVGNFLNEIKQDKHVQAHSGVGSTDDLSQLEQLQQGLGQEGLGDFFNLNATEDDEPENESKSRPKPKSENPNAEPDAGYDDNYETTSEVVASEANADLPFDMSSSQNTVKSSDAISLPTPQSKVSDSVSESSAEAMSVAEGFANMFANPTDDDEDDEESVENEFANFDTGTATPIGEGDDVLNAANLGEIESAKPSYLSTKNWFVHIPNSLAKTLALDVMPVIKTDYLLQDDNPLKHLYINPNAMVTVREMFANHILHDDNLKTLMFAQRSQRKTTNYEVSDNDIQESFDMYVSVSLGLYSQVFWKRYCAAKVIAQLSTKDKKGRVAKMKTIDNLKKFKSIHQVLFNHNKSAKKGPNEVSATIRYYLALGLKEPNLMDKTVNANHVNRQLQRLENSELFIRQLVTLMLKQQFPQEDWTEIVNSKEYKRLVKQMDVLWPDMVNPLKTIQRTGMNKFRKS